MSGDVHIVVAKPLFLCKRARPDIQMAVAFLKARVRQMDDDVWKKLLRLMGYLKNTKDLELTLQANKIDFLKWYINASYAVHNDKRGQTGGAVIMGKGASYNRSTKQNINTRSSTETELV